MQTINKAGYNAIKHISQLPCSLKAFQLPISRTPTKPSRVALHSQSAVAACTVALAPDCGLTASCSTLLLTVARSCSKGLVRRL